MKPRLQEKFENEIRPAMAESRAGLNVHALPRLQKIVVNMGVGKAIDDTYRDVAVEEMSQNARYHWVGEVPRWQVRQEMARARAMVISSRQ